MASGDISVHFFHPLTIKAPIKPRIILVKQPFPTEPQINAIRSKIRNRINVILHAPGVPFSGI
jgi:hypothetical protein